MIANVFSIQSIYFDAMAYLFEIGAEILLKYEFDSDHHSFFEKSSQRIKNEDSENFQNGWMFGNEV